MRVTYLEHSGFLVETADADFLFDYYKGEIPARQTEKPLVAFVSHRHQDHYNPVIFELLREYPDTVYVLDRNVPVKREIAKYREQGIDLGAHIVAVSKRSAQEILLSNGKTLHIETLRSTDAGVAFLLEYDGRRIYHAGDLNLWVWEGETPQYNENMRKRYFEELEMLKGRAFDLAFVPLDPRQEKDAFGGMESFLLYTETAQIFPMHCWGKYDMIEAFLRKHPEYEEKIKRIEYAGQSFDIK